MTQKLDYGSENSMELLTAAKNGDKQAADKLVELNTPLVKSMVRRFSCCSQADRDDLMQIGFVGLIKAIKGFDPTYGVRFSTYAVPMIIGEIKRYLRDGGAVRIARSIKELRQRIKAFTAEYISKSGTEATLDEVCGALGCSREAALEALEAGNAAVSLEQPIFGDGTQDCLMDRLESRSGPDALDIIQLRQCLNELTKEEKQIIAMRYFEDRTQSAIAAVLGTSQVQVSRMESRIIKKLRSRMK